MFIYLFFHGYITSFKLKATIKIEEFAKQKWTGVIEKILVLLSSFIIYIALKYSYDFFFQIDSISSTNYLCNLYGHISLFIFLTHVIIINCSFIVRCPIFKKQRNFWLESCCYILSYKICVSILWLGFIWFHFLIGKLQIYLDLDWYYQN